MSSGTNNIALLKQLEELKKRFEGIDPGGGAQAGRAEGSGWRRSGRLKAGEVEKVVENRIKGLKAEWEKQVATLNAEREALNAPADGHPDRPGRDHRGDQARAAAHGDHGHHGRARSVFKLVNGAPRAFEADGQTVRYGRDGVTPMTLEEWVDAQVSDAPHLFESNAGGGAAGNSRRGRGGGRIGP